MREAIRFAGAGFFGLAVGSIIVLLIGCVLTAFSPGYAQQPAVREQRAAQAQAGTYQALSHGQDLFLLDITNGNLYRFDQRKWWPVGGFPKP